MMQMEMNRRMLGTVAEYRRILAPESNNRADDITYGTEEDRFETNVVVILAALLCALILALGLNIIARCALRCRRRRLGSDGAAGQTQTCPAGLKKNALRKIPVVVYHGSDGAGECPICLGEFEVGEKVRVLPQCGHGFHVRCIDTWLVSHPSCPTCRHSLVDQPIVHGTTELRA